MRIWRAVCAVCCCAGASAPEQEQMLILVIGDPGASTPGGRGGLGHGDLRVWEDPQLRTSVRGKQRQRDLQLVACDAKRSTGCRSKRLPKSKRWGSVSAGHKPSRSGNAPRCSCCRRSIGSGCGASWTRWRVTRCSAGGLVRGGTCTGSRIVLPTSLPVCATLRVVDCLQLAVLPAPPGPGKAIATVRPKDS